MKYISQYLMQAVLSMSGKSEGQGKNGTGERGTLTLYTPMSYGTPRVMNFTNTANILAEMKRS